MTRLREHNRDRLVFPATGPKTPASMIAVLLILGGVALVRNTWKWSGDVDSL